jgi:outer membrane lipoprotein-sorting protein
MKLGKISLPLAFAAVLGLSLAGGEGVARADAAGDKALASVDTAVNRAKTQYIEYDATVKTPDKPDRVLGLSLWLKGEMRLSEFTKPADVKGTKVLIISPTQMYIYLPAFGKVRRIASHTTDQGFMGMTFSQDDFSLTFYAKWYEAKIASQDDKTMNLVLTPKKGETPPYAKIEMVVEKARMLPTEMKYYSDSGTHLKTETRSAYSCEGDVCAPAELKMVDHTKGGLTTLLKRKAWKPNIEIADSKFTKRALEEQ